MVDNNSSLPASTEPPSLVTTSESSSKNEKQSVLVAPGKRKTETESSVSGSSTPNPPALTTIKPLGSIGTNITPPGKNDMPSSHQIHENENVVVPLIIMIPAGYEFKLKR